jgi:chromosome partitioning protein
MAVLDNVLAVAANKGGVGKSCLAGHVAALAANSGWRVLAVDLDPSGNLAQILGFRDRSDWGDRLLEACTGQVPVLEPVWDVRPLLDVIPGGPAVVELGEWMRARELAGDSRALDRVGDVLAGLAGNYDLIVLDLPPGEAFVREAALRFSRFLVIPSDGDTCSNDGIAALYQHLRAIREINPRLEVLGVTLMFVPAAASAMQREFRDELNSLLSGQVRIFEPAIRQAKRAAKDCRSKGLLAHEYGKAKQQALPWYRAKQLGRPPERFAENADGLAEDYQRLVEAILDSVVARREAELAEQQVRA